MLRTLTKLLQSFLQGPFLCEGLNKFPNANYSVKFVTNLSLRAERGNLFAVTIATPYSSAKPLRSPESREAVRRRLSIHRRLATPLSSAREIASLAMTSWLSSIHSVIASGTKWSAAISLTYGSQKHEVLINSDYSASQKLTVQVAPLRVRAVDEV